MRRPYAARGDRYSTLDAALRRINELEDENHALRYDLDRARPVPLSSSTVVSATVADGMLTALTTYERDSAIFEARSRDARDTLVRVLSSFLGHSRGRERDVRSSAMIPAGERDWRGSSTDVSHLFNFENIKRNANIVHL